MLTSVGSFAGICVQTKVLGQIKILMMMWHFTIFHIIITEQYFYYDTVFYFINIVSHNCIIVIVLTCIIIYSPCFNILSRRALCCLAVHYSAGGWCK